MWLPLLRGGFTLSMSTGNLYSHCVKCILPLVNYRIAGIDVNDGAPTVAQARLRLNQMLRELWGPYLSVPAVPVADVIPDSALNYLIARL